MHAHAPPARAVRDSVCLIVQLVGEPLPVLAPSARSAGWYGQVSVKLRSCVAKHLLYVKRTQFVPLGDGVAE